MKGLFADLRSNITCSEAVCVSNKVIQRRQSVCLRGWAGALTLLMKALHRWSRIPGDSGLVGCAGMHIFVSCRADGGLIWDDEVPAWERGGTDSIKGLLVLGSVSFQHSTLWWTSCKSQSSTDWLRLLSLLFISLYKHHEKIYFRCSCEESEWCIFSNSGTVLQKGWVTWNKLTRFSQWHNIHQCSFSTHFFHFTWTDGYNVHKFNLTAKSLKGLKCINVSFFTTVNYSFSHKTMYGACKTEDQCYAFYLA